MTRAARRSPESSIIIEYLDQHYPGRTRFIPPDAEARARDAAARPPPRSLHPPADAEDRRRPAAARRQEGSARRGGGAHQMRTALGLIERELRTAGHRRNLHARRLRGGAVAVLRRQGDAFRRDPPAAAAYLERLKQRPSYARVLKEAEPYFRFFPKDRRSPDERRRNPDLPAFALLDAASTRRSVMPTKSDLIRRYFAAYRTKDRKVDGGRARRRFHLHQPV